MRHGRLDRNRRPAQAALYSRNYRRQRRIGLGPALESTNDIAGGQGASGPGLDGTTRDEAGRQTREGRARSDVKDSSALIRDSRRAAALTHGTRPVFLESSSFSNVSAYKNPPQTI